MPPAGRISGGSRERLRRQLGDFFVASCLAFACLCGGLQADIKLRQNNHCQSVTNGSRDEFHQRNRYGLFRQHVPEAVLERHAAGIRPSGLQRVANPKLKEKSELWVPDLYFINEKRGNFHEITTPNLLLRVKPSGEVTFSQKLTVKLSCNMDLKKFPMDKQKCHLKDGELFCVRMVAKIDERVEFSDDLELPEFVTPPNISTETCVVKYLT
uniref:Neur_chan_LBD domain-containing protein n=1 Tax=Macrostomum lignano TaxID=282301 RepID=A0A1I8GH73_9PLAT